MGISDDIVPKYRPRQSHEYLNHLEHNDSHQEDHDYDLPIIDEEKSDEPTKNAAADTDDFFERKEIVPERPAKKTAPKKNVKKVSSLIAGLLLIALLGYLIVSNYQKIKSLLTKSSATPAASTETKSDQSSNFTSEIKPQDYTATSSETTEQTNTAKTATTDSTAIDKKSFKIQILNGNGITSSASVIKKTLENAGFTIANTGNAKSFSYSQTYIYFKTGKDQGAELVKSALTGRSIVTENSDTIAKTYDIVIVVGKK